MDHSISSMPEQRARVQAHYYRRSTSRGWYLPPSDTLTCVWSRTRPAPTPSHIAASAPSVSIPLLPPTDPTPSHFPHSHKAPSKDTRTHSYMEDACVLRSCHTFSAQWFSSRRSESPWGLTRVGSRQCIRIRLFLCLLFLPFLLLSLSLSLPPPVYPLPLQLAASRRVYGVSRQKRHHGVGWSRLQVSMSIEFPIGWEARASRVAWPCRVVQVEVKGNHRRTFHAGVLNAGPFRENSATLLVNGSGEGGPLVREGRDCHSAIERRKKSLMAIPTGDPRSSLSM